VTRTIAVVVDVDGRITVGDDQHRVHSLRCRMIVAVL